MYVYIHIGRRKLLYYIKYSGTIDYLTKYTYFFNNNVMGNNNNDTIFITLCMKIKTQKDVIIENYATCRALSIIAFFLKNTF